MILSRQQFDSMLLAIRGEHKPMTAAQYKAALAAAGLSQVQAAAFFNRSIRSSQSWAAGAVSVPWPVQWCLEFMAANEMKVSND